MNAIALLQENLPESIEAAWIEDEADRFYLTGMKSSAGTVLVTRAAAWLLIDFRYVEEAEAKVKNCTVLEQKNLFAQAASLLRESGVKVPLRALLPAHGEPVPNTRSSVTWRSTLPARSIACSPRFARTSARRRPAGTARPSASRTKRSRTSAALSAPASRRSRSPRRSARRLRASARTIRHSTSSSPPAPTARCPTASPRTGA